MTSLALRLGLLAATGVALFSPRTAEACGGFFCDPAGPVLQAAERIIFVDHGDGRVTAVVQILYTGPADAFSWVVPMPGIPTVEVSSNIAFTRLQQVSEPRFVTQVEVEGECADDDVQAEGAPNAGPDAGAAAGDAGSGGITVVASGAVGPFDFEIISADPALPNPADVAVAWLEDNGYDVTNLGADLLGPYLAEGMSLVAFRLQKMRTAGDIRPVVLTYEADAPKIPIKLTAVATQPNLGVLVWVVSGSRAVPINYRTLQINEALVDWLTNGSNYRAVVDAAADEAGGQGFVTEYANRTTTVDDVIFSSFEARNWEDLKTRDWVGNEISLVFEVLQQFGTWDGISEVFERHVPPPEGVTVAELIQCPFCFWDAAGGAIDGMDVAAFVGDLEDDVIDPVRETEALVQSRPYLTRLFTTLSAEEMTLDPIFEFNPDLAQVSNVHTATRTVECGPGLSFFDAPSRVVLPDGQTVRVAGGQPWPFAAGAEMPANAAVLQDGTEGAAEVVADNAVQIDSLIAVQNASVPSFDDGGESSSCGCSSTGEDALRSSLACVALILAGFWVSRPRRRRPPPS